MGEVWGSIPEPVKSDTVSLTAHPYCDVSLRVTSRVAQTLRRVDGPRHRCTLRHITATVIII